MNDTQKAQQLLNSLLSSYDAKVKASQANAVDEIRSFDLDLSKERTRDNPLKVSFPFKTILVEQATDLQTYVNVLPESADQGRGFVRMGLLDSFNTEFGMSNCYLFWNAQPNKKIRIVFFTTSNVSSGRLVIDQTSQISSLKCGHAETAYDGYSFITENLVQGFKSCRIITNATGMLGVGTPFGLSGSSSYFNGAYTSNGSDYNNAFKVPKGYRLRFLSSEVEYRQALMGDYIDLTVGGVPEGFTFDPFNTELPFNQQNFEFSYTPTPQPPLNTVFNVIPSMSLFQSSSKLNPDPFFIDENQLIAFASKSSNGAGGSASGSFMFRCLWRLERKVGS